MNDEISNIINELEGKYDSKFNKLFNSLSKIEQDINAIEKDIFKIQTQLESIKNKLDDKLLLDSLVVGVSSVISGIVASIIVITVSKFF